MKVGLLVSRSGPAGLWAPSCDAGAMLAAAEINAAGGVLGRNIDLVIADAGWSESEAIMAAGSLVDIDGVDAVVGMHPSNVRGAIKRRLSGSVPYIYTPQYEGGERGPYTVTTGGTDGPSLSHTHRFAFSPPMYAEPSSAQANAYFVPSGDGM